MTYSEKLKDPRWQKKRLEIFNRDDWTCQKCKATDKTLVVHHLKYSGEPWEIENEYLKTLCESCHELSHDDVKVDEAIKNLLDILSGFDSQTYRILTQFLIEIRNRNPERFKNAIFVLWASIAHDSNFYENMRLKYNENRYEWEQQDLDRCFL